jgi:hypothetical protein
MKKRFDFCYTVHARFVCMLLLMNDDFESIWKLPDMCEGNNDNHEISQWV